MLKYGSPVNELETLFSLSHYISIFPIPLFFVNWFSSFTRLFYFPPIERREKEERMREENGNNTHTKEGDQAEGENCLSIIFFRAEGGGRG